MTSPATAPQEAEQLLVEHGLRYKPRNPCPHTEDDLTCGMCHHFDVIHLKHAIASSLEAAEARGRRAGLEEQEVAQALQESWKTYTEFFGEPPHGTEKQLNALAVFVTAAIRQRQAGG